MCRPVTCYCIKRHNTAFENVEKLKYLLTTVTKQDK